MTEISDLLADTIAAGVGEALRNNADRHTKWRTGEIMSVVDETTDMRQIEVHLDGDPRSNVTRMRSLGDVSVGQRALVVFTQGGGVWCLGALGGVEDEPRGAVGLLGEVTSGEFIRWYDALGHNYPATLEVPCVAGVPILFQFTWAADCGRSAGSTFLRVHVVNQSSGTGDFQPYVIAGDYMTGSGVGSYYERTAIASILPTGDGTVTAQMVPQFEAAADPSPSSGHGFGSGADDFTIRAFG